MIIHQIPTGVNSPYLNYGNNNHNVACRVESGGNVYGWIIGESCGRRSPYPGNFIVSGYAWFGFLRER